MRHPDGPASWEVRVDQWNLHYDIPLWLRAAERIDVPAGGVVPGPLDLAALPAPSRDRAGYAGEVGAEIEHGWRGWWELLVAADPPDPLLGPAAVDILRGLVGPEFTGLGGWPHLRALARRRWWDALAWHEDRKRRGVAEFTTRPDHPARQILTEALRRTLDGTQPPVELDLVLLPVVDDEIREVPHGHPRRYLVPERVVDSPQWPQRLERLLALG